jgi:hypothetical protein
LGNIHTDLFLKRFQQPYSSGTRRIIVVTLYNAILKYLYSNFGKFLDIKVSVLLISVTFVRFVAHEMQI